MTLTNGTRLGPYAVLAPLGSGGMGEVYRGRDTRLDRDVAIKILPEAFAKDPDRLARLEREAKLLASLNHPGIAAIYALEAVGDLRLLVMELAPGATLEEKLGQGSGLKAQGLPLDDALAIATQIASALGAAHAKGIIHRDLKPANIKVDADGKVKVLDFGLAKALGTAKAAPYDVGETPDDYNVGGVGTHEGAPYNVGEAPDDSPYVGRPVGRRFSGADADPANSPTMAQVGATMAGLILGTAAYMSPEQARGKTVDARTDIWAFGCVLFEMLTGKKVFPGETITDRRRRRPALSVCRAAESERERASDARP